MGTGRPLTDRLYFRADALGLPLSGTFELSPLCNFACRMCYVRQTPEQVRSSPRGMLTLAHWRRIAREAREAGTLYLLLTGGEPLLWPDFWTLYDELVDMGFLVSVNTNGSLIDDEAIARFRRKPPHKLSVTLYGAGEESYRRLCGVSGVFDRVDRAIRGLQAAGITLRLNCSLTPDNGADRDAILAYARERELYLSMATYMFPPVRQDPAKCGHNHRFTPEEAAEHMMRYLADGREEETWMACLRKLLDGYGEPPGLDEGCVDPVSGKIRCRAGRSSFWITWDGWMLPCGMMPQPNIDMKQNGFAPCWQELKEASAGVRLSGVCDTCPNRGVCHPCAAMAWAETGSAAGIPVYRCHMVRRMRDIAAEICEEVMKNEAGKENSGVDSGADHAGGHSAGERPGHRGNGA